jgi:hypothetical protein
MPLATTSCEPYADAALFSHMSNLTPPVPRTANGSKCAELEARLVQAARLQRPAGRLHDPLIVFILFIFIALCTGNRSDFVP